MCGISGKLLWGTPVNPHVVSGMNDAISHRGPDASGIYCDGPVVLGQRRLSIIDLSEGGRQPMLDGRGEIAITFNGEIYNYQQLRTELKAQGAVFRSASDTEVILEAYRAWGTKCLERLNGMFAFAIWDKRKQELFLARDRLGKKPLYYYLWPNNQGISFSSELKGLLADPELPFCLNDRAVLHYLMMGYVLTSQCIASSVIKLQPGHFLQVSRSKAIKAVPYWDLAKSYKNKRIYRSINQASEELLALLDDAVKLRLVSDVPLGAFLSGGIDSSAIVAAMCQARGASSNLTFSIGFDQDSFDETKEATRVATHLGVPHHKLNIDHTCITELSNVVEACDEVFADSSMIPMYLLARFTRQHVTVALSGDGADEIFCGYETYIADLAHKYSAWIPKRVVSSIAELYRALVKRDFGKVSTDYKILHFLAGHKYNSQRAHFSWRQLFSDSEMDQLLLPEKHFLLEQAHPFNDFDRFFKDVEGCALLDQTSYVDIKTWLVDDILVKADRTTMASSLEARAPFLDYRIVEFAASLPQHFKLKGLDKKHILKLSQRGRLPQATLARKKSGFNSPISSWLLGALKPVVEELIRASALHEYVDPKVIARLYREHSIGQEDNSHKLFALINFHLWMKNKQQILQKAA